MNKLFFQIEPLVYSKKAGSSFLFYNEINNKHILLENINDLYTLNVLKRLFDPRNNGIVELKSINFENNPTFSYFIEKAREINIGHLLQCKMKPIQISTLFKLPNDFHLEKMNDIKRSKDVMRNLREITIYINETGYSLDGFNRTHRQFLFPISGDKSEISLEVIERICSEICDFDYLKMINVIGGNISKHSKINDIIKCLDRSKCRKTYHFVFDVEMHNDAAFVNSILSNIDNYLIIYFLRINNNILQDYSEVINFINEVNISRVTFCNIVSTEKDIKLLNSVHNAYNKQNLNIRILPYFNGHNISFFKNNVFVNKRDILYSKYNVEKLISNRYINSNFFGRLIIDTKGNIYSNINKKKIGNVVTDSFHKIIYSEINQRSAWFLTRHNVSPCNTCILNELCPPVSNYELSFQRFNLCKIVDCENKIA